MLRYLRKQGLKDGYLKLFSNEYSSLLMALESHNSQSMNDYLDTFVANHVPTKSTWKRYAVVKKIVAFVLYGKLPYTIDRTHIEDLPDEYQQLIQECLHRDKSKGNSAKNQKNYEDSLKTFFAHLNRLDIKSLTEATEDSIQSYFTCNGEIVRGYNTLMLIKRFLTLCEDCIDPNTLVRIRSFLPCIKKKHKLYPALTDAEAQKIRDVLQKDSSRLSELAKAIGSLAFFTGLRTCDIVGLKIQNIDWNNHMIYIIQRKTQVPIQLTLNPIFANHIYRYIKQERPKSNDSHIFLRQRSKKPMDSHDAYKQCVNIMYLAGIRQVDSRRGFHLFRHHLATKMIDSGSDFAIVSALLGHRDPRTTFDYLSADFKQLKQCSLPITKYIQNEDH